MVKAARLRGSRHSPTGTRRWICPARTPISLKSQTPHDQHGPRMAGHSQFKNIMHRKGRQDAARSKLFAKLAREITTAARNGLPDPDMNARLRLAIQAARAENMPKDNIERAIKKAAGARRRELRGDPLRGLWPRRRRRHRRGADRQPQPHRRGDPRGLHQARRQSRRHGRRRPHVLPRRRDRLPRLRRLRRRHAGGRHRGGCRGRRLRRQRPHHHLRLRGPVVGLRRVAGQARDPPPPPRHPGSRSRRPPSTRRRLPPSSS